MNKQQLESTIEFLKSQIIILEPKAFAMNSELEDLSRRLEEAQIDLATLDNAVYWKDDCELCGHDDGGC